VIPTRSIVNDLSAYGIARATIQGEPLDKEQLRQIHAFWSACNYLALGMIYIARRVGFRNTLNSITHK
jgi:xylulose-5-phosphate/fructose-6-phosphate phosphoketolase